MADTLFPIDDEQVINEGPVTCLGIEFENDEKRREYFRNELRKKLPELRLIEGFPIGEDDDIIALSDPPYYTACPNPWINSFIKDWEKEKASLLADGERDACFEVKEPYATDVSEGKYNDIYFKHPYHTKVPIAAIEQYLNHYTQPGDIIFDGFAGTGMTAVAAQLNKRKLKSITLDLSPIASYINYYYNYSAPQHEIERLKNIILPALKQEFGWLYETSDKYGQVGEISSVIWSDVFICPHCNEEVVFWESGVDVPGGKVLDEITCPHCGGRFKKNNDDKCFVSYFDREIQEPAKTVKIQPVRISYKVSGHTFQKLADDKDLNLLKRIDEYKFDKWIPTYKIPSGDKTPDALKTGINHIHQLYFKRTLIVLSALYCKINDPRLLGIITSIAFRINKRYALTYMSGTWGAGGGPTNGTYYIPSLLKELNIFDILDAAIKKCEKASFSPTHNAIISTQSATKIQVLDNSIDYIFTDPPFGGNLMYSELNYVWESWLKVFTENSKESITSPAQNKNNDDYLQLMTSVFREYYRVLKPGRWLSVEFSNTKAAIWNILQQSLQQSGFVIANVSSLDKKKGSFNAQTSVTAVKQDLVISCYKPSDKLIQKMDISDGVNMYWDFVEELLEHLPVHLRKDISTAAVVERSPKILYDRLIAYYVQRGFMVPLDAIDFQKGLKERFVERDGMFFTAEQAIEYEDKKKETTSFVSLALLVGSEEEGIEWLKRKLEEGPKTYSEILPGWMQDLVKPKKGDTLPELMQILDENFLKDENGYWHIPDLKDQEQLNAIRNKRLLREFEVYKSARRIKGARLEALRAGFKDCYNNKDFTTILEVGNKLPEELLSTDTVLLRYYDIASSRV